MTQKTYQMESFACPSCVAKIQKALDSTQGVTEAEVLFNSSRIKVKYDQGKLSPDNLKQLIEKFGYKVLSER